MSSFKQIDYSKWKPNKNDLMITAAIFSTFLIVFFLSHEYLIVGLPEIMTYAVSAALFWTLSKQNNLIEGIRISLVTALALYLFTNLWILFTIPGYFLSDLSFVEFFLIFFQLLGIYSIIILFQETLAKLSVAITVLSILTVFLIDRILLLDMWLSPAVILINLITLTVMIYGIATFFNINQEESQYTLIVLVLAVLGVASLMENLFITLFEAGPVEPLALVGTNLPALSNIVAAIILLIYAIINKEVDLPDWEKHYF